MGGINSTGDYDSCGCDCGEMIEVYHRGFRLLVAEKILHHRGHIGHLARRDREE